MKKITTQLIALLFISFALLPNSSAQSSLADEFSFEVNRIYPYISISKEKLNEAQTIVDLNAKYKSSWVKTYISVEVLTTQKGKIKKAIGKNERLTPKQKDLMNMADVGTDISVRVQYLPENNLSHNETKEMDFKFSVNPKSNATYTGGQKKLNQYLKENAIDKIPNGSFEGYDLTIIKFTIDEVGKITDAHIFDSGYSTFKNEKVDALLLEAIQNMPRWKPATYANGIKVKQEFALTVGNHKNCVLNLINIREDGLPYGG